MQLPRDVISQLKAVPALTWEAVCLCCLSCASGLLVCVHALQKLGRRGASAGCPDNRRYARVQAFTLVLAICLSIGSPKPSAVFSVRCLHTYYALRSPLWCGAKAEVVYMKVLRYAQPLLLKSAEAGCAHKLGGASSHRAKLLCCAFGVFDVVSRQPYTARWLASRQSPYI